MKKILLSPWLALVTLALILTVRFIDPDFSQVVRLKYFDQLIASQPHKESPVVVINIDEATLEKYGQFPFPRGVYAKIIDDLYKRNAGLVVFGVMMPEADRFGEDDKLAAALGRHPVILPQVAADRDKNDSRETSAQVIGNTEAMVTYGGVIASVPVIQNRAAGVGVVNTLPEIDGVVRRLPLVVSSGDRVHPALALETVRIASGDTRFQVKVGPNGVEALRIPEFGKIPVDSLGRVWVDYSVKSPQYSAVDLPDDLGGKIVIVGLSAAGLQQPIATGVGEVWPQDLQAMLLDRKSVV
jgi:adenylate cyclase